MSDYNSALPIRTEGDLQEKVQSKIVDFVDPSLGMQVDSDKNAHVEMHGNDAAGTDRVVKLSENGNIALDGDYDASTNTNPSSAGIIASDRSAAPGPTTLNKRPSAIVGDNDKTALDVAISDSNGNSISETNPLWVVQTESPGTEICDYSSAAAVAAGGTSNHTYAVTVTDLELWQIEASASGKCKIEIKVGVAASEVTKAVLFNSTANPNMSLKLEKPIKVAAGEQVLIIRTNKDNQPQDLYSSVIGLKKV